MTMLRPHNQRYPTIMQGEMFPDLVRVEEAEPKEKPATKALIPRHPLALRLCQMFKRRITTPWSPRMRAKFIEIRPHIHEDDMLMCERRYRELWPPERMKNSLRHDLETFMNNYGVETDRARIYCEKHPLRAVRKVIPFNEPPPEPVWDEGKAAETKQALAEFRKTLRQ